ncbi:aminoglycoside nucleotidyltransferase [bacterium]|nr:aminoglycoside nucleotidyltransferase [bacterium]
MRQTDVVELYETLNRAGVPIWIDGGWAVDAAVGRQTRSHDDLDIAVEAKSVPSLRQALVERGYREVPAQSPTKWNFVLAEPEGRKIDVHVVMLDPRKGVHADPIDGIAYPAGSLTGDGVIAGVPVQCVKADFLLEFKTAYPPREIDRADVALLCALLGRPVPVTHL